MHMYPGYHEASGAIAQHRDDLVELMEQYLDHALSVGPGKAYDIVTGEPLGFERVFGDAYMSVTNDAPSWTLTDFHHFERYGVILDGHDNFERSLEMLLARI